MFTKIILPIIVGILLLAGIGVGVYIVRQQQDIREKAAPATSISFTPSQDTMEVGESKIISVDIDTGLNVVSAIKLYMVYDPALLRVDTFTRGTFFQTPIQGPSIDNGRLSMVAGGQVGNFPTGTGQVAILRITALRAGSAVISIDEAQTEVMGTDTEVQTNVIRAGGIGSSSLTIQAQTEPTTTPTPTQSVTPTPSESSTLLPTVTPTPTPTPTPTVTPTPTPTPISQVVTPTLAMTGGNNAPTVTPSPTQSSVATTTPTSTIKATTTPTNSATNSASLLQAGVGTTTTILTVTGSVLAVIGLLLLAL